jgi:hypothetical protein
MMRPKTPAPKPRLTRDEHYWLVLYNELMERYSTLAADWSVPMMAVRVYTKRVGLDSLLALLTKHGVPMVAERCRHEMTLRQEFFAALVVKLPPDEPGDIDELASEMAGDLAMIDGPDGGMRLLRFLDRLRTRELLLQSGNHKVTH